MEKNYKMHKIKKKTLAVILKNLNKLKIKLKSLEKKMKNSIKI